MDPERWQRLEDVFHAAAERPLAERDAYLDHACATDAELRAAIDRLLQADDCANASVEWRIVEAPPRTPSAMNA